jgi:hypothetical protein
MTRSSSFQEPSPSPGLSLAFSIMEDFSGASQCGNPVTLPRPAPPVNTHSHPPETHLTLDNVELAKQFCKTGFDGTMAAHLRPQREG